MIDPVAFSIGPLSIRWYGIAYATGLLLAGLILKKLNQKASVFKYDDQIMDFLFWVFLLGVVAGGRLGYVLFYNLSHFIAHPAEILAIWQGGMSFHGGLIGALAVGFLYCKKHALNAWRVADLTIIPTALALAFGRLANFVNRELLGHAIENPDWLWLGVDFGDGIVRYPTQLFAVGKDLLIFAVLLLLLRRKPRQGVLIASFLVLYGVLRFLIGFLRMPDEHIGFLFFHLTLGQLLNSITLLCGLSLFYYLRLKK